jgi:hypothetical protein
MARHTAAVARQRRRGLHGDRHADDGARRARKQASRFRIREGRLAALKIRFREWKYLVEAEAAAAPGGSPIREAAA